MYYNERGPHNTRSLMSNGFQYNDNNSNGGYVPPPHNPGPMGPGPSSSNADTLAMVSVITGALALLSSLCCCIPLISYLAMVINPMLAVIAIVTGFLAHNDSALSPDKKTLAKVGIGLGIGNFVFIAVLVVIAIVGFGGMAILPELMKEMN